MSLMALVKTHVIRAKAICRGINVMNHRGSSQMMHCRSFGA